MRSRIRSFALLAVLGLSAIAFGADPAVERMYKSKCGGCHGNDGKAQTKQGEKMKMRDLTSAAVKKELTDEKVRIAILDGIDREKDGVKQEMKPLRGKLTDEQVAALVAYVRGLK